MAKKEKTIELKQRVEKISEEHLKELQNLVNGINGTQFNIGKIEAQKHELLHNLSVIQNRVQLMQDTLTKEYGSYDVSLEDGTINWPKTESNGLEKSSVNEK
tara:strand:+ start:818 stop:1123 length:306 start_codon:yes stop_codon:yes gene_type:complete